ncbi:MAG: hypothetical protein RL367_1142 [Pseudomonadota bacterium]|jgi:uncharacterized protein (DUF1330 family)
MPAYMIFTRTAPVRDQAAIDTYSAANQANGGTYVSQYKMRPLSVYGKLENFEGTTADGVVLLEFPTADDARAWYNSPEYQEALVHRLKGADYDCVLVEGL